MKTMTKLKFFAKKRSSVSTETEHDVVDDVKTTRDLALKYWQDYLDETNKRADLIKHYYGKPSFSSTEECLRGLQEHLDLAELDDSCTQKRNTALQFFRQHPEAWQQGDEIAYFYDSDKLQKQMKEIFDAELDYIRQLLKRIDELDTQLNNANKVSGDTIAEDIQNERSYYVAVLDGARRTLGDKIQDMWWNAIPEVIKQKYAKEMDDKMVCLLAENNDLTAFVLNFYVTELNLKACRRFVKTLEKEFNSRMFTKPEQNVQFAVATRSDFDCNGNYNYGDKRIAIRFADFKYGYIDDLINTVKHECLGHHVDNVAPSFGLQGYVMQDFVNELFNGKLVTHGTGPKYFATAKSPMLQQHYCVNGMSEDEKTALAKQGWYFFEESDKFEFEKYRAMFTERSAFSLEKTGDYVKKINAYRQQHVIDNTQNTK